MYVMMTLSGYMRPAEAFGLRQCDVIPPVRGISKHWCVLIAGQDVEQEMMLQRVTTKTGIVDGSLVMDSLYLQDWLGDLLLVLMGRGYGPALVELRLAELLEGVGRDSPGTWSEKSWFHTSCGTAALR